MLFERKWNNKAAIILLYLLLAAVFVSYIPIVYLTSLYEMFGLFIMGIMLMLVVLTIFKSSFGKNKFITTLFVFIILIAIEFLIFLSGNLRFNLDDIRQIIIVFFLILIGYTINISNLQLKTLCFFYIIGSAALGLYAVVFYTGFFSFAGNRNLITGKNQIGAMVAVGGAIAAYFCFVTKTKKTLYFILTVFVFAVSAVLRDRSAFVALIFFVFLLGFKKYSFYKVFAILILMVISYYLFQPIIDDFFSAALMGRGEFNVNDLSTGRAERNEIGILYIQEHFWEGELQQSAELPWIHNYLLLRLVRYGIWCVFFIAVYMLFLLKLVKEYIRTKMFRLEYVGFFVPIIPFFISLLEPSFPFGPGTVQIFVYVLFGQALQKKQLELSLNPNFLLSH